MTNFGFYLSMFVKVSHFVFAKLGQSCQKFAKKVIFWQKWSKLAKVSNFAINAKFDEKWWNRAKNAKIWRFTFWHWMVEKILILEFENVFSTIWDKFENLINFYTFHLDLDFEIMKTFEIKNQCFVWDSFNSCSIRQKYEIIFNSRVIWRFKF